MQEGTQESSFESLPHDEGAARAHLERRLGLFGLVVAAFQGGTLLVLQVLTVVFFWPLFWRITLSPGRLIHLASVLVMVATWLACRRARLSPRGLQRLDEAATVAYTLLMACDLGMNRARFMPDLILVIVLTNLLTVRAALVPSTARRSFALGVFATIAAVVASYAIHSRGPTPLPSAAAAASVPLLFMAMAVGGTTLTSRIIYGLRRQATQAARLGQYLLEEKIGEGGMGVVYKASHAMLKRPTAVKLVSPDKANALNIARFEREVRLTSRLSHPNTIAIYDYGRTADGIFYYAMEYLDGLSLDALIAADGPQPDARIVHIVRQISAALAEAHGIGLIHRDIKPANIMLCQRGGEVDVVKVLDFGLVKRIETRDSVDEAKLSTADTITGTPLYMAPEAILAPDRMDGRADLYAVGAVGYFLLTGSHVFTGRTPMELCMHHLQSTPIPLSKRLERDVDPRLEAILLRCLSKDASDRPASASDLAGELEQIGLVWTRADAARWWARRPRLVAAAKAGALDATRPAGAAATMTVDLTRSL